MHKNVTVPFCFGGWYFGEIETFIVSFTIEFSRKNARF